MRLDPICPEHAMWKFDESRCAMILDALETKAHFGQNRALRAAPGCLHLVLVGVDLGAGHIPLCRGASAMGMAIVIIIISSSSSGRYDH